MKNVFKMLLMVVATSSILCAAEVARTNTSDYFLPFLDCAQSNSTDADIIELVFKLESQKLDALDPQSGVTLYKHMAKLRKINKSFRDSLTPNFIINLLQRNGYSLSLFPFIEALDYSCTIEFSLTQEDFWEIEELTEAIKIIISKRMEYDTAMGNNPYLCLTETRENNETPLLYAALRGEAKVIDAILNALGDEAATNLNRTDAQGNSPLHLAALSGSFQAVKRILNNSPIDTLNRSNSFGSTPLIDASRSSDTGTTETFMLIFNALGDSAIAALNHQDKNGQTPLYYAAWGNNYEIVDFILNQLGDGALDALNQPNHYGETALEIALSRDATEVVKLIQKRLAKLQTSTPAAGGAASSH